MKEDHIKREKASFASKGQEGVSTGVAATRPRQREAAKFAAAEVTSLALKHQLQ